MTSTYTIKPLEWERVQNAVQEMHIAPFGFHKAVVYRRGERWEAAIDTPPDSLDGFWFGRCSEAYAKQKLAEGVNVWETNTKPALIAGVIAG